MEQLKESIEAAMYVIEETTVLFYQQKAQAGYEKLDSTLNYLVKVVNRILAYQENMEEKLVNEALLNTALTEAMKAMEQKDIVLLADILTFEINGILEETLNRI